MQIEATIASRIERADDRAGAGADDNFRVDALRFKYLDYANVGETTGGPAAQCQADFDRFGRLGGGTGLSRLLCWEVCRTTRDKQDNQEMRCEHGALLNWRRWGLGVVAFGRLDKIGRKEAFRDIQFLQERFTL